MADFLLIHGAWHGAWCWDRLLPVLAQRGHRGRAIDLPGGGADSTPMEEITLACCVQRIVDALDAAEGKTWLVGHSLGGTVISQAAEMAADQIAGFIYVAASLPADGQSHLDALGPDPDSLAFASMIVDVERGGATIPPSDRAACFYGDCDPADTAWALNQLRDWQAIAPAATTVSLSPERFGRIPRFYVECIQDKAISLSVQRHMQNAQGVSAVATLDSSHSPFLSMPEELARTLDSFVRQES